VVVTGTVVEVGEGLSMATTAVVISPSAVAAATMLMRSLLDGNCIDWQAKPRY
jgi:hypothetical protein